MRRLIVRTSSPSAISWETWVLAPRTWRRLSAMPRRMVAIYRSSLSAPAAAIGTARSRRMLGSESGLRARHRIGRLRHAGSRRIESLHWRDHAAREDLAR